MGTQSRIMKFFKFFTSIGILSIAGGIAAKRGRVVKKDVRNSHSDNPPWLPYDTSCICPDMCVYTGFSSSYGKGICVNMSTVLVEKLTKLVNLKARSPPDLCPQDDQGNQGCCRCLKNRCRQTGECYAIGGICGKGNGVYGQGHPDAIQKLGICGKKSGCECYRVKQSSYPGTTYNP